MYNSINFTEQKEEFMKKHNFNERDLRNLKRYQEAVLHKVFNYLNFMMNNNVNGGKRLAEWILKSGNYDEYLTLFQNIS